MSHSCSRVWLHIILGVKNREPLISPEMKPKLIDYLDQQIREKECVPYLINGTEDHLHVLVGLSPKISIADLIKQLKGASSHWINQRGLCPYPFSWQIGYGCFSVSESQLPKVINYIKRQKEHHRKMSFQEEFERFMERCGVKEKISANR